jgi:hypothetical protein
VDERSRVAAILGAAGGKAGRGKSKVRGDSAYYRKLVGKRKSLSGTTSPETNNDGAKHVANGQRRKFYRGDAEESGGDPFES